MDHNEFSEFCCSVPHIHFESDLFFFNLFLLVGILKVTIENSGYVVLYRKSLQPNPNSYKRGGLC